MTRQIFAVIGFLVLTAQASFATQYDVTVSGTLNNYSATLFGDDTLTIPVSFTFKVDSADATLIPANTAFSADGSRFATDAYRISKEALTNLSVTVGLNGTFTNADLVSQSLSLVGNYDLLITGSLASPTAVQMSFNDSALGIFVVGSLSCPTSTCTIAAAGYAESFQDSGLGEIATLFVSSQISGLAEQTLKVNELIYTLEPIAIANKGLKKVLTFDLLTTKRLISDREVISARKSLNVFLVHIQAAQNGGSLTAEQAAPLIAKAVALRDSL